MPIPIRTQLGKRDAFTTNFRKRPACLTDPVFTFSGCGILLDIEGTTSSVSFVYDVMFAFVRRELDGYLQTNWGWPPLVAACEVIARDAGRSSFADWRAGCCDDDACRQLVRDEILRLMDGDVKATGLKQLQGLIWQAGFASGELKAHVYEDVPPALAAWNAAGFDVRIFSSGSVPAQRLFFGHTIVGDLRSCFRGHFDTTIGSKKESASYARIAAGFLRPPHDLLFGSDVSAELDAARLAGFQTVLCVRPGNAEVPPGHGHPVITNFAQIVLSPSPRHELS